MAPLKHERRFLKLNSAVLFVLVVGILEVLHIEAMITNNCSCKKYRSRTQSPRSHEGKHGESGRIACCPFGVLGFDDPNAKIQWTHNGTLIDESNGRHVLSCGNQELFNKKLSMSDSGTYICNVTSSNGTVGSSEIRLKVSESSGHHEGQKDVQVTDRCSWRGDAANITCQAMVGKRGPGALRPSLSWWYITSSGTIESIADDIIKNTLKVDDQGILTSTLVFKSVRREHYGIYLCQIGTIYNTTQNNATFTEGDPHDCKTVDFPKIFVVLIATTSCLILAILYLWWRFRIILRIMYRRRKHKAYVRDCFLHDVFIVHGDRVSSWISGFVYTLEETYGYSCYVPGRDMLGGEQIADAIYNEMKKSRRVLVVITPCLLQSQWALWSAENGIHTCLKDSTIFGVVLQEYGNDVSDLETNVRLKTLNPILRFKVPKVLRLKENQVAVKEKQDLNKKPSHQKHTHSQFFTRLRSVLVGDPKTVFWQKVRLYLDPPTMRRKITVESTA